MKAAETSIGKLESARNALRYSSGEKWLLRHLPSPYRLAPKATNEQLFAKERGKLAVSAILRSCRLRVSGSCSVVPRKPMKVGGGKGASRAKVH